KFGFKCPTQFWSIPARATELGSKMVATSSSSVLELAEFAALSQFLGWADEKRGLEHWPLPIIISRPRIPARKCVSPVSMGLLRRRSLGKSRLDFLREWSVHAGLRADGGTSVIISRWVFRRALGAGAAGSRPAPVWATLWLALSKTT